MEPERLAAAGANSGDMPCGCGGGPVVTMPRVRTRPDRQRENFAGVAGKSPGGVFRLTAFEKGSKQATREQREMLLLSRRISSAQAKRLILNVVSRKSQAFRHLQVSTT